VEDKGEGREVAIIAILADRGGRAGTSGDDSKSKAIFFTISCFMSGGQWLIIGPKSPNTFLLMAGSAVISNLEKQTGTCGLVQSISATLL
jgi:hypothetical protein